MKQKNFKFRSKLYHFAGTATIFGTTLGGFFGYQAITDFEAFKEMFQSETLMVIDPETVKLNPLFAIPIVVGILVFLFVTMKRDRDFFKGRASLGITIALAILYGIYSIAIMTMAALAGALAGSLVDEIAFTPLSKRALVLYQEQREVNLETEKEKRRIAARRAAREAVGEVNDFGNA